MRQSRKAAWILIYRETKRKQLKRRLFISSSLIERHFFYNLYILISGNMRAIMPLSLMQIHIKNIILINR